MPQSRSNAFGGLNRFVNHSQGILAAYFVFQKRLHIIKCYNVAVLFESCVNRSQGQPRSYYRPWANQTAPFLILLTYFGTFRLGNAMLQRHCQMVASTARKANQKPDRTVSNNFVLSAYFVFSKRLQIEKCYVVAALQESCVDRTRKASQSCKQIFIPPSDLERLYHDGTV